MKEGKSCNSTMFNKFSFRIRQSFSKRAYSLTWPTSILNYWNKRNYFHKKRVQLQQDFLVCQHGRRFIVWEHLYGRSDVM